LLNSDTIPVPNLAQFGPKN